MLNHFNVYICTYTSIDEDGRVNSFKLFSNLFDYMSRQQIRYTFADLNPQVSVANCFPDALSNFLVINVAVGRNK